MVNIIGLNISTFRCDCSPDTMQLPFVWWSAYTYMEHIFLNEMHLNSGRYPNLRLLSMLPIERSKLEIITLLLLFIGWCWISAAITTSGGGWE